MSVACKALLIVIVMAGFVGLFLFGFIGISHGILLLTVFNAPLIQWFLFTGGVSMLLLAVLKGIDLLEQPFSN